MKIPNLSTAYAKSLTQDISVLACRGRSRSEKTEIPIDQYWSDLFPHNDKMPKRSLLCIISDFNLFCEIFVDQQLNSRSWKSVARACNLRMVWVRDFSKRIHDIPLNSYPKCLLNSVCHLCVDFGPWKDEVRLPAYLLVIGWSYISFDLNRQRSPFQCVPLCDPSWAVWRRRTNRTCAGGESQVWPGQRVLTWALQRCKIVPGTASTTAITACSTALMNFFRVPYVGAEQFRPFLCSDRQFKSRSFIFKLRVTFIE